MKSFYTYLLTLLLASCVSEDSFGSWDKIKQFSDPIGCGYFFDADHGLVGSGQFAGFGAHFLGSSPLNIYLTSDGGKTWIPASVPQGGTGRITSIFMKNSFEGYASIYSETYSIWKTTDGGLSWVDFSQKNYDLTTSVYATDAAIIKTIWFGNSGGSSTNGGASYSQTFSAFKNGSNGIDFADATTGIVTLGPGGGTWMTRNGGVTWSRGDDLPEAWSIYALRGTQFFFALPEDGSLGGQTVYQTQDAGSNWTKKYTFHAWNTFTGHIAGAGSTLYVQTDMNDNEGLFRSDDLGQSWTNVGGPSNTRDTRFVVTGCKGQVVYAFDPQGGVWKTIDGGDGAFGFSPRIGAIESKRAGEITKIPVYLDSTVSVFSIDQLSGNLRLNTDLLTPIAFDTVGTLSYKNVGYDTLYSLPDGSINFLVKYTKPIKNGVPLSRPLIYIRATVYLSAFDTTSVFLNSLDINAGSSQKSLIVCSTTESRFTLAKECGDTTLQQFIKTGGAPDLFSIFPNPDFSESVVEIRFVLPNETRVTLELIDAMGKIVRKFTDQQQFESGEQKVKINIDRVPSGSYFLRLRTSDGKISQHGLVLDR